MAGLPNLTEPFEPRRGSLVAWTPARLRSAESQAENGDFTLLAELCEDLIADDRISGLLDDRVSLFRLPLTIDPADESQRAKSVADEVDGAIYQHIFPDSELAIVQRWALVMGFAPVELRWRDDKKRPVIVNGKNAPTLNFRHPRNLRQDTTTNEYRLRVGVSGEEVTIDEASGAWWLYAPRGGARPWTNGLWNSLKLWWLVKQMAIHDWARKSELHGLGTFVTKSDPDVPSADGDSRKALAKQMRRLGSNKSIHLPPGFDLDLVEAKANTVDIFDRQISAANTAFAIAVSGQNLTSEIKGGSLAAQEGAEKVLQRISDADEAGFAAEVRSGPLGHYARVNHGSAALAPTPNYDTAPPEDENKRIETLDKLGDALVKFKTAGFNVDNLDEVTEELGLKLSHRADDKPIESPDNVRPGDEVAAIGNGGSDPFYDGQEYADRVTASAARVGGAELSGLLEQLISGIQKAETFEEVFSLLESVYGNADPKALAQATEKAYLLAQHAGKLAVSLEAK